MQLETILQILYANKLENVVSHAIRIEANIPLEREIGQAVVVNIHKQSLPKGFRFENGESWGNVECEILAINIYSMDKPYLVRMPNGQVEWKGLEDRKSPNGIIAIEEAATIPA